MDSSHGWPSRTLPLGMHRNVPARRWFEVRANTLKQPTMGDGPGADSTIEQVILGDAQDYAMAQAMQKEQLLNPNHVSVWIVACDMINWQDQG